MAGVTFSRDGRTMYTASLDGAVFKWDVSPTGGRGFGRTFSVPQNPDSLWPPLAIAPSGKTFATTDGTRITLWSTSNLAPIRSFGVDHAGAAIDSLAWAPGPGRCSAVGWSTVTGHGPYNVYVGTVELRTETGALVRRLPARPGSSAARAGRVVARRRTGGGDHQHAGRPTQLAGTLAVWDAHSGRPLGAVSRPRAPARTSHSHRRPDAGDRLGQREGVALRRQPLPRSSHDPGGRARDRGRLTRPTAG